MEDGRLCYRGGGTRQNADWDQRRKLPENSKPENMSIQDQNNCRLGAPARTWGQTEVVIGEKIREDVAVHLFNKPVTDGKCSPPPPSW